MSNENTPFLELKSMSVDYGPIHALKNLSIKVFKGEIVTILGANGAGKTTTLKAISGLLPVASGEILFKDKPIKNVKAHQRVKLGIAQSPEGRMVFPELTVLENLEMGHFLRSDSASIKQDFDYVYTLFPRIQERKKQYAGTLSGGEQQMLAIARAIMSAPELLLLDEPSLGIAPIIVDQIMKAIKEINKTGKTILLVEQNAFSALKIAHRAYVLETGELVLQGDSKDLLKNDDIKRAYLGH